MLLHLRNLSTLILRTLCDLINDMLLFGYFIADKFRKKDQYEAHEPEKYIRTFTFQPGGCTFQQPEYKDALHGYADAQPE